MIEPTQDDIGRTVYYRKEQANSKHGVITGFSPTGRYVFVRYGTDALSKATRYEDLYWNAVPESTIHDAPHQVAVFKEEPPKVIYCCDAMERTIKSQQYPICDHNGEMPPLLHVEGDENIPLQFCLFCGAQLWRECPSCHGYGEVMYRAPDPDGGSTPEPRGCGRCNIFPGMIPLAKPIPRFEMKELTALRDTLSILMNAQVQFKDTDFESSWKKFLNWRGDWIASLGGTRDKVIMHIEGAKDG